MNQGISEKFVQRVSHRFSFLTREYGFSGPYTPVKDGYLTKVVYRTDLLAIEFVLERVDFGIECNIALIVNGKISDSFDKNPNGRRMKRSLRALLIAKGVRSGISINIPPESTEEEKIDLKLAGYEDILTTSGKSVLAGSPDLLL
jgi:hypothetical protein